MELGFDTSTIEATNTFEAMPAGWYTVVLIDESRKETKTGNGDYLKLEFEITEGPYKGRKLWEQLSIWHKNPQTVEIAKKQMVLMAEAAGVKKCTNTEQIFGKPFEVKVVIESDEQWGDRNRIKGYKKHAGLAGPMAPPPQTQQKAASAAPWKR